MSKYRVPVGIIAYASYIVGEVECDTIEEFYEKADELWESTGFYTPTTNISNDFDLDGEWEIPDTLNEADLKYYRLKDE